MGSSSTRLQMPQQNPANIRRLNPPAAKQPAAPSGYQWISLGRRPYPPMRSLHERRIQRITSIKYRNPSCFCSSLNPTFTGSALISGLVNNSTGS